MNLKKLTLLLSIYLVSVVAWPGIGNWSGPHASSNRDQQVPITGTVTDEDGQPLPGATIVVKDNPSIGVATDLNGNFSIDVEPGSVLVFSFVGMTTQEVLITEQQELSIQLIAETKGISEVMVVAYGVTQRETFTGSATVVNSDKIEKRPVSSFTAALAANTSGIVINTSGQPGDAEVVRIRGTGSFNASLAPLYVVDGIAVNMSDMSRLSTTSANPMASINPSDIASITVLKIELWRLMLFSQDSVRSTTSRTAMRMRTRTIITLTERGVILILPMPWMETFMISGVMGTMTILTRTGTMLYPGKAGLRRSPSLLRGVKMV